MAPRTKQRKPSWLSSILPKSRQGQFIVGALALLCTMGAAYYAGVTNTRLEASAEQFVERYQHIDQRPYRNIN